MYGAGRYKVAKRARETNESVGSEVTPGKGPVVQYPYKFQCGATIAGRYEVIRALGFGGFSEVYHCRDGRMNREVALKIIPKERLTEKVRQEAQTTGKLEHQRVVQVYDVASPEQDPFYITMRLLTGGTLEGKINQAEYQRLELTDDTLQVLQDVAEALDYAHSMEVLHRDVKPSNILLDEQGRAYLADFGLARAKRLPGESAMSADVHLSGTIPYMSPEQVGEKPIDHRADVYALGVVAYEVLTGQLPYRGRSSALLVNIARSEPIPPRQVNPDIPERVEEVLLKVLDKDPDKRFQTCSQFVRELRQKSQAYREIAGLYDEAVKLVEAKEWHQALDVLRRLEEQTPGYRETRLHLERAKKQVQLLDLYAEAESLLKRKKFQECLDKLNVVSELDAAFDVAELRERALQGLADEQREALAKQYRRAVEQYEAGELRACLDTLETIRKQDPHYPDDKGIEPQARDAWERQQRLAKLYQTGLEKTRDEEWEEAIQAFEALKEEDPAHPDVETQLTMARHLSRLSGIRQRADSFFQGRKYAACIGELDQLASIDQEYRQKDVVARRQESVELLYRQAVNHLADGAFEEALDRLKDLFVHGREYGDPEGVGDKARAGIVARELQKRLQKWYEEARDLLDAGAYRACLDRMLEIKAENPQFPDRWDVEQRAREGERSRCDRKALDAYHSKRYKEALKWWEQARQVDPDYEPPAIPYEQARKRAERGKSLLKWAGGIYERLKPDRRPAPEGGSEERRVGWRVTQLKEWWRERRPTWLWPWGVVGGGGIVVLIVLGLSLSSILANGRQTPTASPTVGPSDTPTVTPMATHTKAASVVIPPASETPTEEPTATPTHSPSFTKTSTGTPTPTRRPTDTPTPTSTLTVTPAPPGEALCTDAAAIFPAPRADSAALGYVAVDESVTVIGRAADGRWLYVRDDDGVEGFVWLPYFDWPGDINALPPITPTVTVAPRTPTSTPTLSSPLPLSMDFWPVPDNPTRCVGNTWVWTLMIRGQGGNQVYTYYLDDELLAGPLEQDYETPKDELVHVFDVRGACGAARIVVGRVESGDGQSVERSLFLDSPACCPSP